MPVMFRLFAEGAPDGISLTLQCALLAPDRTRFLWPPILPGERPLEWLMIDVTVIRAQAPQLQARREKNRTRSPGSRPIARRSTDQDRRQSPQTDDRRHHRDPAIIETWHVRQIRRGVMASAWIIITCGCPNPDGLAILRKRAGALPGVCSVNRRSRETEWKGS
jgi:hypothetical protein